MIRKYLVFFCFCLIGLLTRGQQYNIQVFSVRNGLSQSQVYDVVQDQNGLIWAGTRGGGVSIYDGHRFTSLNSKSNLEGTYINCFLLDPQGRMWVGTDNSLERFDGSQFIRFKELQSNLSVNALANYDEAVFIGCSSGLFKHDISGISEIEELQGLSVVALCSTESGLMGAVEEGLFLWKARKLNWLEIPEDITPDLVNVLFEDSKGTVWIGTYGEGVWKYDQNEFTKVQLPNTKGRVIFDVLERQNKEVWLASLDDGIFICGENGEVKSLNKENGLPVNQVRSLWEDDWGNVWIGTSGAGLAKFSGQDFMHWDQSNGLPGPQIYSVTQQGDSIVWIGAADEGLVKMRLSPSIRINQEPTLRGQKVKALFTDHLGRVWAGTDGKGIRVLDQSHSFWLNQSDGLGSNWIRFITEDHKQRVYVATAGGGICRLTPENIECSSYSAEVFNTNSGLPENRVNCLQVDTQNRVWFGTVGHGMGVLLEDGTALSFDTSFGLPGNGVRSLALDGYNQLWIGTSGNGIARMDLDAETLKIEPFEANSSLSSTNIYFLLFDHLEHLWVGTERGVDHLKLDVSRKVIDIERYGKNEGYEGIEACTNAAYSSEDGTLWFGTIDGLSKHHPEMRTKVSAGPKIRIQNLNLFYKPLSETPQRIFLDQRGMLKDTLVFTYEQNHVGFDFLGVHQQFPDDVVYQWYLEGEETGWTPQSPRTTATYSNLAPGTYVFHLKACVKEGPCAEERPIVLHILRPFWMETWFFICAIGAMTLMIVGFFFWRVQVIKQNAKDRNQRLSLERDVIELEQKALRLQMNPHFIFNTLNSIQGLIARKDEKTSRLYLSKFSRLMRQILEHSREELIPLEEECQALTNYLELEQFTHENAFTFEIETEVDATLYMVPPLVVQPFVENAIVHGILPKGSGHVKVYIYPNQDGIYIDVEDDGVGRAKAAELKAELHSGHRSAGVEVTTERLQLLADEAKKKHQVLEIIDKTDDNGISTGTIVRIWLPKLV